MSTAALNVNGQNTQKKFIRTDKQDLNICCLPETYCNKWNKKVYHINSKHQKVGGAIH